MVSFQAGLKILLCNCFTLGWNFTCMCQKGQASCKLKWSLLDIHKDLEILEENEGKILSKLSDVVGPKHKALFQKFFFQTCFHLSLTTLVFNKVSEVFLFFNSMPLSFLFPNMPKAESFALLGRA